MAIIIKIAKINLIQQIYLLILQMQKLRISFKNKNIIYRKSCSLCSPYPQTIENTHLLGEHNFCRLCSPPTPPPGSFFFFGNFSGSYHPSTPSLPSRSSQGGFFEFSGTERGNPARFYTLCIPLRWVDQP